MAILFPAHPPPSPSFCSRHVSPGHDGHSPWRAVRLHLRNGPRLLRHWRHRHKGSPVLHYGCRGYVYAHIPFVSFAEVIRNSPIDSYSPKLESHSRPSAPPPLFLSLSVPTVPLPLCRPSSLQRSTARRSQPVPICQRAIVRPMRATPRRSRPRPSTRFTRSMAPREQGQGPRTRSRSPLSLVRLTAPVPTCLQVTAWPTRVSQA